MTHYNIRSEKELFELFSRLTPAQELQGVYQPEFPGAKFMRPVKLWGLGLLGLPGWQGKQFFGDNAVNIITCNGHAAAGMTMKISIRPHKLDGELGLVATYPEDAPLIWRHCTDEFRVLDECTLLGMTHFDLPMIRHKPMMFVLHHAKDHAGVSSVNEASGGS